MLLREYIQAVLAEGDVIPFRRPVKSRVTHSLKDPQGNLHKTITVGPEEDEVDWEDPESIQQHMGSMGSSMTDALWTDRGGVELVDDSLDEWHTDLERVMFNDDELEFEDPENPARTGDEFDDGDPYTSANKGLKTSRGMQHTANMGSGRSPGSNKSATFTGGRT